MIEVDSTLSRKLLSTALAISFLVSGCGKKNEVPAARAIPVKLQTLESRTLIDSSEFVGTLKAHQVVSLAPQIDGRILKLYVTYGARVKKGTPILLLEPIQQQEDVNAATGNLNAQRASLITAEANLRGTEAERDAAAAQVATSKANLAGAQEVLKQREAELKREEAQLALAKIDFDRSKFLVPQGVRPQQDLDDKTTTFKTAQQTTQAARQAVAQAKASVNASKSALNQTIQNLKAAGQRVAASRADVNRQRAAINQAQGQLGSINQNLLYNQVLAPIDGVVANIYSKVGDVLNKHESFTEITDNSLMEMNVNIPTERSSQLRLGLPVEIIQADGSTSVTGQIGFISPTTNQNAQAILTKVFFRNDGSLRNNQYVRVRVIWNRKPGVLVPTTAVTSQGAQKFVFVAEKGKSEGGKEALVARQKPVALGNIQGQAYQVISGIKAGERIALSRILDLRDGTPITEASLTKEKAVEQ